MPLSRPQTWFRTETLVPRALLVLLAALAALAVLGLLAGLVALLLKPTTRTTSGACTHYAAPTGTGTACTEAAPCLVSSWWALAGPGRTLCLADGTYQGSASMIDPPDTLAGRSDAPITIKALHDGQVLLDAQGGFAVYLAPGNHFWAIEGLNARSAGEALYRVRSNHVRLRRVIGWDGTAGQADANIFSLAGADVVCEDCAGWGANARKIFSASQTTAPEQQQAYTGFRRAWGEWNAHPGGVSCPNNTYQLGYRSRQQRFENLLGTADVTGSVCDFEGVIRHFYDCADATMRTDTVLLGALLYAREGATYPEGRPLVTADCSSRTTFRDVVAFVGSGFPTSRPFTFMNNQSNQNATANVCDNCLAVHAGTPSVNQPGAGWELRTFHEGQGLEAATGGVSPFTLLPGLCYRYVEGVLTRTPLWPWPMNQRILAARALAGRPPVDVTAEVERMLGPIPDACRSDRHPPVPLPPGPVALSCVGNITAVPGTIALTCTSQEERR